MSKVHSAGCDCLIFAICLSLHGTLLTAEDTRQLPATASTGNAVQAPTRDHPHDTLEILSDTQGVDFGPYLRDRVLPAVRSNWYALIPASAQTAKGQVAIEFSITEDGKVAGMKLVATSGNTALDRAAWGGIVASNPFPSLPVEYKGNYVALRFRFFYNPDSTEGSTANTPTPAQEQSDNTPDTVYELGDGVTPPKPIYHPDPQYTDSARKKKINGTVVVAMIVTPQGSVRDVKVTKSLDEGLDKQALAAVRTWRFEPATKDGKPVAVHIDAEVNFRLY